MLKFLACLSSSSCGIMRQVLLCFPQVFLRETALAAYGSYQARGANWSLSCQLMPQPQQCQIWAASVTYTTAHGNAGSLTHGARPGIEPASLWILVRFVSTEKQRGNPIPQNINFTELNWNETDNRKKKSRESLAACIHGRDQKNWVPCENGEAHTVNTIFN